MKLNIIIILIMREATRNQDKNLNLKARIITYKKNNILRIID